MIGSLSGSLLRGQRRNAGCLVAFGAVFFLFGGFFVVMMVVRPFVQAQRARDWVERPCRILSSEVSESSDNDGGTTYGVKVRYEYTVGDRRYEGDRYDFARISDSNRGEKQRIVDRYRTGSEAACWVDPKDPSRSVINRDFVFSPFLTFFTLSFPTVGAIIMVVGVRSRRATAGTAVTPTMTPRMVVERTRGVVVLTSNERAGTAALLVFSLLWNGIVWTIGYFVVYRSRGADMCAQAFLGLFALVGLALLYAAVRKVLEGMKPRPGLRLNTDKLRPGGSVDLQWGFSGDTGNTTRLRLTLIGREAATYRRGTSTSTDKSVFARLVVVDTSSAMHIQRGTVSVPIPPGTMHTFLAPNNRIEWALELVQEIPNWPDVKCEYPVTINLPEANHA